MGAGADREHVAAHLATQAAVCRRLGSELYGTLLEHAATDLAAGGPLEAVLTGELADHEGAALPLRLMAAVHRMVLEGSAPALAPHFPSVGGTEGADGAWPPFRNLAEERGDDLRGLVARPCQTNEVGRCAGLILGFLAVARATGLPLRLLEVGTSAGLNLRWDRYRYETGNAVWGPPGSPVVLRDRWEASLVEAFSIDSEVVERRGCDPDPLDPLTDDGRLTLTASVWGDQVVRLAQLRGALSVAREVPARVDRAGAGDWLEAVLADPADGAATVVFHSVVEQYIPREEWNRAAATIERAGTKATHGAPLAWLRMEPDDPAERIHRVELTMWPGGQQRYLATTSAHGDRVWVTGT